MTLQMVNYYFVALLQNCCALLHCRVSKYMLIVIYQDIIMECKLFLLHSSIMVL